jgi:hypothetical protein
MSIATQSKITAAALAIAVLVQPGAALAKSICVFDAANSAVYMFSKPKLPKKPGETTTVQAATIYTLLPASKPCGGAITRLTNGSMKVGLTCYGDATIGWQVGWTAADATLVGTAHFEYDGDRDYNDLSVPLSTYDCENLTIP